MVRTGPDVPRVSVNARYTRLEYSLGHLRAVRAEIPIFYVPDVVTIRRARECSSLPLEKKLCGKNGPFRKTFSCDQKNKAREYFSVGL